MRNTTNTQDNLKLEYDELSIKGRAIFLTNTEMWLDSSVPPGKLRVRRDGTHQYSNDTLRISGTILICSHYLFSTIVSHLPATTVLSYGIHTSKTSEVTLNLANPPISTVNFAQFKVLDHNNGIIELHNSTLLLNPQGAKGKVYISENKIACNHFLFATIIEKLSKLSLTSSMSAYPSISIVDGTVQVKHTETFTIDLDTLKEPDVEAIQPTEEKGWTLGISAYISEKQTLTAETPSDSPNNTQQGNTLMPVFGQDDQEYMAFQKQQEAKRQAARTKIIVGSPSTVQSSSATSNTSMFTPQPETVTLTGRSLTLTICILQAAANVAPHTLQVVGGGVNVTSGIVYVAGSTIMCNPNEHPQLLQSAGGVAQNVSCTITVPSNIQTMLLNQNQNTTYVTHSTL